MGSATAKLIKKDRVRLTRDFKGQTRDLRHLSACHYQVAGQRDADRAVIGDVVLQEVACALPVGHRCSGYGARLR